MELPKTVFEGYTTLNASGKVIAIIDENGESVTEASEGECSIVLDATSFYGEGGGQVGDTGALISEGVEIEVVDTKKSDGAVYQAG